jgi:hypothetical protein
LSPPTEDSLPAADRQGVDVEVEEQADVQVQVDVQVAGPNRRLPLHLQSTLPQRRLETDLVRARSVSSDLSERSVSRCGKVEVAPGQENSRIGRTIGAAGNGFDPAA